MSDVEDAHGLYDPDAEKKPRIRRSRSALKWWIYSRDGRFVPDEVSEFRGWDLALQFADENIRGIEHEKEG